MNNKHCFNSFHSKIEKSAESVRWVLPSYENNPLLAASRNEIYTNNSENPAPLRRLKN